mmetsp:Transcript_117917/g.279866  ORF Transcript_117917/g.279866 Transcript_117917/m.279866 type:complete len:209 (+) Transcript_117917:162-788(+)
MLLLQTGHWATFGSHCEMHSWWKAWPQRSLHHFGLQHPGLRSSSRTPRHTTHSEASGASAAGTGRMAISQLDNWLFGGRLTPNQHCSATPSGLKRSRARRLSCEPLGPPKAIRMKITTTCMISTCSSSTESACACIDMPPTVNSGSAARTSRRRTSSSSASASRVLKIGSSTPSSSFSACEMPTLLGASAASAATPKPMLLVSQSKME